MIHGDRDQSILTTCCPNWGADPDPLAPTPERLAVLHGVEHSLGGAAVSTAVIRC